MYKIFTTSLALAFASFASAQETVTATVFVTTTVTNTYTSSGIAYTATSAYSYPTTTAVSAAPPAQTHVIQVGPNGTLSYSPNNLNASIGDTLQFVYNPKNHTVTQSSFGNPCEPLLSNSTGIEVNDSGFRPVNANVTATNFTILVNDTAPIWIFCRQKNPISHCAAGMVAGYNTPGSGNKTFAQFLLNAKATNASSSASPSGAPGNATGTATGAGASSTEAGGSGAMATSVNFGLTAFLAVVGVFMLAL